MNKCLTTDMADANELERAIRPTGFHNIKKMATNFCSTQCIMDNTGSLTILILFAPDGTYNSKALTVYFHQIQYFAVGCALSIPPKLHLSQL